jgi:hypothetical protein
MRDPESLVVPMTIGSTVFLVVAIIVILIRSRTPEMKLLMIGIFMSITAAMQASITGIAVTTQQVTLLTGLGSATFMKISVILTLAGIGMLLLVRVTPPAMPGPEKEQSHVQ